MNHMIRLLGLCLAALAPLAQATTLQRLSFEELTDTSDAIVTGEVTRTWTAWDAGHHYIWTHYEVAVSSAQKGAPAKSVELAEPGGVAEGLGMSITGSVVYKVGDSVLVFLQKMPNGMSRTTGWSQGKYTVDSKGRLHAEATLKGVEFVDAKTAGSGVTSLTVLDGLTLQEAGVRVAARIRATQRTGKVQ
ncbi:MAG TPA: hypothetical protein VNH18_31650 [Bryobacteraceae bacterium]|nr:hypothetical protein [Bryobacteraceae bacterium]